MDKHSQIQRDDKYREDIIRGLVDLGFLLNDARVYISLYKLGASKPVKISEDCDVDRSRVYDSLRRLIKKGYVEKEPVKWGPSYKAKNPRDVLRILRKEFRAKRELASSLEKTLEKYQPSSRKAFLVSITGEQPIFKEIISLITLADEFIEIILTPDFSMVREYFIKIVDSLIEKKNSNPNVKIEIALNHEVGDFQFLLQKMHDNGIIIYLWYIGNVLPYGLYLTEKSYIFTTLDSIGVIPTYNIGLTIENARPGMTDGYIQLFAFNNASYFKRGKMKKFPLSPDDESINVDSPENE